MSVTLGQRAGGLEAGDKVCVRPATKAARNVLEDLHACDVTVVGCCTSKGALGWSKQACFVGGG